MSISIIIPSYNRGDLLPRALRSVVNQTCSDWELIIVDDGSSDDTQSIVRGLLSHKIRYVRQEKGGANKARNLGASLARFKYLAFLDSDDELVPHWAETVHVALADTDPAIVCCGTVTLQPGRHEITGLPRRLGRMFNNATGKFSNGGCYVIDRELFFKVGRFDEELRSGQHTELAFRLAELIASNEVKVTNIFEPLVKIHIHSGPRIRGNSDHKFKGARRTLQKHSALLAKEPNLKRRYAKIVAYHAFRRKDYACAVKSFATFCKYSLLAKVVTQVRLWQREPDRTYRR